METRAFTRRRFFYTINEVQQLCSVAQNCVSLALAAVSFALGLPRGLLRFAPLLVCLASQQLLIALEAVTLMLKRSTQQEETYEQCTWRDYRGQRDFRADFRFSPDDMDSLVAALELPPDAKSKGYAFNSDEAISILLFTLATNATLLKVNQKFGIKRARASAILAWSLQWTHDRWYKPLFVTDFQRWAPYFEAWAAAVHRKQGGGDGTYDGIIAFIDGTFNPTCRPPPILQRAFYSGYKKKHGVHWQGCLAPCGILIDMSGPFEGRHSDKYMLNCSEICERLRAGLNWAVENLGAPEGWPLGDLYFFADAGYNRRLALHVMYSKPPGGELTAAQTRINRTLATTRIVNEWIFGRICSLFPYVAVKTNMKVERGNVGVAFSCAAILTNALTCLDGNATSQYFDLTPPNLEEYFGNAPMVSSCPAAWYENAHKYDPVDA